MERWWNDTDSGTENYSEKPHPRSFLLHFFMQFAPLYYLLRVGLPKSLSASGSSKKHLQVIFFLLTRPKCHVLFILLISAFENRHIHWGVLFMQFCAANRKKLFSALPNVGPYIYEFKISGFTRSSTYIRH
jgi:hypothetical protein